MLFGTAGIPHSSESNSTTDGIRRIRELGLECMEVQFVRGVKMGESYAKNIKTLSKSLNVVLSVHAPYYINLNADSEVKVKQSLQRLYDSARIGSIMGAESIVFHPGYYMKRTRDEAFRRIKSALDELLKEIDGFGIVLRPETSGKREQFGELNEIIDLCSMSEGMLPCIDISHIHARTGEFNSYEGFSEIFELVEKELGKKALKSMHIHVSGIKYDSKGEKTHLNLKESDLNYIEFLRALRDYKVSGCVICESPNLEEDALLLKKSFFEIMQTDDAQERNLPQPR